MTSQSHISSTWTSYLRAGGSSVPSDPETFKDRMCAARFPRASAYDPTWVYRNLMGPNSLWLVEDLAEEMELEPGMRVLDLGCGSAITSIFLAREYGAVVWATDLWVEPSRNLTRIEEAGVANLVFPIECGAHALPFARGYFDRIISLDAYHYFGTEVRYLSYLAQFLRRGGLVGIEVPGNAADPDDHPAVVTAPDDTIGADWFTFRSSSWWERHWRRTTGVEVISADMVSDGWELWHRYIEACAAWEGAPVEEQGDAPMLLSGAGRTLGFARVIAERSDQSVIRLGPGRFTSRLA